MRVRRAASWAAMVAAIGAASAATAMGGSPASAKTTSGGCHLANGVKHVIEITFDNVHYNRDNPNVPSDLEQMPALQNFITNNGTLLSNNHTPLIAHTADDSLTNYTGLYGDRHGQGLTNTYETYNGNAITPKSSFAYWTGTYGLDPFPNQPYSAKVPAVGSPPSTPPGPWVSYTRAHCNFGAVSTANMVLENTNPDLANVYGANSPEVAQLNHDSDSFKDQEGNDYVGLGVHCTQHSPFCSTARAVKYGTTKPSHTAVADVLPDEPGGYSGYQALFGHKYLQPQLKAAARPNGYRVVNHHSYQVFDSGGNLVDLNGNEIDGQYVNTPGFPGFGPISAAQSLAYVADMQESGVPVTDAYISDAHEQKPGQSGCSNSGSGYAQGPGDPCYQQTLAAYNQSFAKFFQRLADDGINKSNTLFVITADEGDHFAGANANRALAQPCSTGTCTYPSGTIGEQAVSIHGLLSNQLGDTTSFYNEPQGNSVFITGNPGPTDPTTRTLERDFASAKANDAYDGNVPENLAQYEADPAVEQLLHFVNADPNRTPSFTVFPKPDFYLSAGRSDSCGSGVTTGVGGNSATKCSSINRQYAWNHGYYAPEIDNTWLGLAGPGVANKHVDGSMAGQGPSSDGTANSNPQPVTSIANNGTWADHTDIQPTMMALSGLKDDYTTDGRVLTEDMTATPGQTGQPGFKALAVCYKQLNSSVGKFGTDMLVADTNALKTGSGNNDSQYQSVLSQIKTLGAARDALATQIKNDLFNAEFNNTPVPGGDLGSCTSMLSQADQLASG